MESKSHVVVVPNELTIDKMFSLFVYTREVLGFTLEQMDIHFEDEYLGKGIPEGIPDIDVRQKYNKRGFGSALECLARVFPKLHRVLGMDHLIDILNRNNKTGYLKSDSLSLVWLIRQMPRLAHNCSPRQHRLYIIGLFWSVCEIYFAAAQNDENCGLDTVTSLQNPFTMEGYMKMWDTIESAYEGDPRFSEFDELFTRADAREEQAQERAIAIQPTHTFEVRSINGGKVVGHYIESDDDRVPRRYFHLHPEVLVLLARKPEKRNYAVFTRGSQNLNPLFQALSNQEPDRWDLVPGGGSAMLLNGSSTRARQASDLKPLELIELVTTHLRYRSRSEARRRK